MNKNNSFGIRPGPSQTCLYSHISRSESWNFGFKKKKDLKKNDCTIFVATKALINCAAVQLPAPLFSPMHIVGYLMRLWKEILKW